MTKSIKPAKRGTGTSPVEKAKPAKAAKPKRPKRAKSDRPAAPATKFRPRATKPWSEAEITEAFSRFEKASPEPKSELEHVNPFTLLVAVVLSAQATDAGVNRATKPLFADRRHAAKDARARRGKSARFHQDHRALSQQGAAT